MRRLILLLAATAWLLTGTASAEVPTDPRITEAVKSWANGPLYIDPEFDSVADRAEMLKAIERAPGPMFVAVVPNGDWFAEKGDTLLLAGWMAAANGKPGTYVVMDDTRTYGVAHETTVRGPGYVYGEYDEPLSKQLASFVDRMHKSDVGTPKPARTEAVPPRPESDEPDEEFTVGTAIGNGLAGGVLGLMAGGLLGGVVLAVAAFASPRGRKGRA
jgi:hypothetical protein